MKVIGDRTTVVALSSNKFQYLVSSLGSFVESFGIGIGGDGDGEIGVGGGTSVRHYYPPMCYTNPHCRRKEASKQASKQK